MHLKEGVYMTEEMLLKAIQEYYENCEKMALKIKDRTSMSKEDVEHYLDGVKEKLNELLIKDMPYAELLMDLEHLKVLKENKYISLTEIAKRKNSNNPSYVIQSWLRDKNTIEFLSLWEKDNNPEFNLNEFENLRNKLSEPSFTVTAKAWITKTNAKGIISKQGNNGGTLAHHDIAVDFITWLFPEKRYELIKMIGFRIFRNDT